MADTNRFLLNTDYDSQKVVNTLDLVLTVPAFSLGSYATSTDYTTDATCDEGQYFENVSTRVSTYPGIALTTAIAQIDAPAGYNMYIKVYRSAKTTYSLVVGFVNQTSDTVNIPEITFNTKVNLLIPSAQD